jgi:hypothetical protein
MLKFKLAAILLEKNLRGSFRGKKRNFLSNNDAKVKGATSLESKDLKNVGRDVRTFWQHNSQTETRGSK